MDFADLWETVNENVDWLIAAVIALFVIDVVLGGYLFYVYTSRRNFHKKHDIRKTGGYEEQKKKLRNLPSLAEIEVEPPEETKAFPERYTELEGTDLFVSLAERMKSGPGPAKPQKLSADKSDTQQKRVLPPITGFEVMGRIVGKEDTGIGVIKDVEKGKTYVAREGDYLKDTEIRVVAISDTEIRLKKPEHQVTSLQFKMDQMSEEIRRFIHQY